MRAIQFGAGNIGRGFIGKILADAGWKVTFADVNEALISQLNEAGQYPVNVVGQHAKREMVTGIDAILSTGDEIIQKIADTDMVTTAVGPVVLPKIAPVIAKGLVARKEAGTTAALNIVACENMIRGTSILKEAVFEHLDADVAAWVEANVGFADSAVDRIVPPSGSDDPLEVTVEEFSEWIVDETQLHDWTHDVPGMELTDNLMAFIERKLFTLNTGHAITAYLGARHGLNTIRESILNADVATVVKGAMEESGEVLKRRYGFGADTHAAYIEKILGRFANPYLEDDVRRVGREPLRKLGKADRLVRPLLGTIEYDLPHDNLVTGIVAALRFENPDDPQTLKMHEVISEKGLVPALREFTEGVLPDDVYEEIAEAAGA